MRLGSTVFPFLLLLGPAAMAEDAPAVNPALFAEPTANPAPTAFACSIETLLKGVDCVFETDAPVQDPTTQRSRENAALAAGLAPRACARLSLGKDLDAVCQADFRLAAQQCASENRRPLLDSRERFSPGARSCYFAMGEVLRKVVTLGAVAAPCCRCLAAKGCFQAGGERCLRSLGGAKPELPACAEKTCADACAPLLEAGRKPEPPGGSRPPAKSREI